MQGRGKSRQWPSGRFVSRERSCYQTGIDNKPCRWKRSSNVGSGRATMTGPRPKTPDLACSVVEELPETAASTDSCSNTVYTTIFCTIVLLLLHAFIALDPFNGIIPTHRDALFLLRRHMMRRARGGRTSMPPTFISKSTSSSNRRDPRHHLSHHPPP